MFFILSRSSFIWHGTLHILHGSLKNCQLSFGKKSYFTLEKNCFERKIFTQIEKIRHIEDNFSSIHLEFQFSVIFYIQYKSALLASNYY